jgi:tape measure domain-containing protein
MEDVAKLYTRIAVNAEALGLSQTQVLSITRSISQAMQVSGSTASEAAAGVLQFTQAIASSNFAGDELRTLLESQPRLLKAIGDGLRILSPEFRKLTEGGMATTAALRTMGSAGKLSADLLLAAISTQRDALNREFAQLPRTVAQTWTQAMNVVNRALAGVSVAPLTDAIDHIKEKFQDLDVVQRFTRMLSSGMELVGGSLQLVIGLADRLSDF